VTTFHDLFVMTGEYSTPEFRQRFTAQAKDAAQRADIIIAVSEFTRGQVIALLGADPARVKVVRHGIRALAFPRVERERVVLAVGAIQKRKNTARLVEAFETLGPDWRLVLAGSGSGYAAAEILARIGRSPARGRILLPGYVTPSELAAWYARAAIFAFPSLDEGFGMPVLEAMAAGTPVLTANRSAMPEVAGNAAVLVDPEDSEALAAALARMAGDPALREELGCLGRARTLEFTWERAVRETWAVYRELTG
jgi:glycosyltransferase involved in cell wall biosynthesis